MRSALTEYYGNSHANHHITSYVTNFTIASRSRLSQDAILCRHNTTLRTWTDAEVDEKSTHWQLLQAIMAGRTECV